MNDTVLMISELLVIAAAPAGIVFLSKKIPFFKSIGAITLCYALGFLLSLSGIPYSKGLSETIASVVVAIAIPLILFCFDVRSIRHLARKTVIGFALVIVSVITVSTAAAFIGGRAHIENPAALSGMAAGLYIGGTPNLFAIGKALLNGDMTTINLANIADSIIGGVYFLLLVSVIKSAYARFLGRSGDSGTASAEECDYSAADEYDFSRIPRDKAGIIRLLKVLLLAVLCLGVGVLIEIAVNGNMDGSLFIMITVSVLGIALSLIKPIREVRGTYQAGQYLILVFSLGLSMSIDLNRLVSGILPTLIYFSSIQIASLLLHFILCRIFKIDGGTAIITGTAGIYGPPFIAPVANAYGDRSLIVPGVICGTFGLIAGNLIGIALGAILAALI